MGYQVTQGLAERIPVLAEPVGTQDIPVSRVIQVTQERAERRVARVGGLDSVESQGGQGSAGDLGTPAFQGNRVLAASLVRRTRERVVILDTQG